MDGDRKGYIGRAYPRKEDDRLLRGYGAFIDDLPEPQGTLSLCFVRSYYAHAKIVGIDTTEAEALPGVVAVLTGADFAGVIAPMQGDSEKPGYKPTSREAMPVERVRFVGDAVAVVVAEDPYIAEDAAELVEVDLEALPAAVTIEDALAEDAPLLHEEIGDNVPFSASFESEGFQEAFDKAAVVVSDSFRSARMAAVSMEPRGCMATYDRGKEQLTVWSSTQVPHLLRTGLAELLDWPENAIRVVAPDVGGGFGMKAHIYPEEAIAAALAKKYAGTVKWIGDRQDDFLTSTHSRDYRFEVEMAVDGQGMIQAVRNRLHVNIGAYACFPYGCSAEAGGGAIYMPGAYRFPHYSFQTSAVHSNTAPVGVYRGVAAPVAHFAAEGLIDRAARELGIDPVEMRRRNLIQPEDFPFVNVVGIRYDTGSHVECLEKALKSIGYDDYRREQPAGRLRDGKYRGIGVVAITEHTGQGAARYRDRGLHRVPGFDSAFVKIEPRGQVIAYTSHATQGQGHLTAFAQIIAENLGMDPKDVTVVEGDTSLGPYGSGTFASRAAVVGGGAAYRASENVAAKLRRIAGHHMEVAPDDLELVEGAVRVKGVPEMKMTIREISAIAYSMESRMLPEGESYGLEATDYYDPPGVSITNAVHAACVAVDAATGRITVERYAVAHDCGRVINPLLVAGQVHGAVAQGLGEALMEGVIYDEDGQILTSQLLDYLLPSSADVPDMKMDHVESPSLDTVAGFKGAGEGGVIGSVPAIASAVNDALAPFGVFVNRLPMKPDYILELIESATAGKGEGKS